MEEIDAIAKITDSKPVGSITDFLREIVGKPMIDSTGILYIDSLRERREYNALMLKLKYEKKKAKLLKTAPLDFTYQLLDKASLVEDENLQDYWASLLANATDASIDKSPRKIFIDILSKLEPQDVKVFERIVKNRKGIDKEDSLNIDALVSLNIIEYALKTSSSVRASGALDNYVLPDYYSVAFTPLGRAFYKAVSR